MKITLKTHQPTTGETHPTSTTTKALNGTGLHSKFTILRFERTVEIPFKLKKHIEALEQNI